MDNNNWGNNNQFDNNDDFQGNSINLNKDNNYSQNNYNSYNQQYQSDYNTNSTYNNGIYNDQYTNSNEYNYGNQYGGYGQQVYPPEVYAKKARTSLITGIISFALTITSSVVFWGSIFSIPRELTSAIFAVEYFANVGLAMIISGILTIASFIVGIVSVVQANKHNKMARESGCPGARGMNTTGMVFGILGLVFSSLALFGSSCVMCTGCCAVGMGDALKDEIYSENFEFDDYDTASFAFDDFDMA